MQNFTDNQPYVTYIYIYIYIFIYLFIIYIYIFIFIFGMFVCLFVCFVVGGGVRNQPYATPTRGVPISRQAGPMYDKPYTLKPTPNSGIPY